MTDSTTSTAVVEVPRAKLNEFQATLGSLPTTPKTTVQDSAGLSTRPQLGQIEIVEVLIHAGSAVALHEIVTYIKSKISYAKVKEKDKL
jgi:hypothetical protein